jgi:hypothetical protein
MAALAATSLRILTKARMSAYSFHLDADAPLRNSSTDWKEQQRFLAWQKVAVGKG